VLEGFLTWYGITSIVFIRIFDWRKN